MMITSMVRIRRLLLSLHAFPVKVPAFAGMTKRGGEDEEVRYNEELRGWRKAFVMVNSCGDD